MKAARERAKAGRLADRAGGNEGLDQNVVGRPEVNGQTDLSGASTGNRHSRCPRLT